MRKFLIISTLLATSACVETAGTPDAPTAVTPLVGKTLTSENGTVFLFDGNGNVGGTFRGEAIVGTYETNGAEVCSTYSAPATLAGSEYCSTPIYDGDTVIFNRRDGSQSQVYTISG